MRAVTAELTFRIPSTLGGGCKVGSGFKVTKGQRTVSGGTMLSTPQDMRDELERFICELTIAGVFK